MQTFLDALQAWPEAKRTLLLQKTSHHQVRRILQKEALRPEDFLALLSQAATDLLEELAQRAQSLTLRYFGRAITLFTPLYISDVCTNQCRYCGFNAKNPQKRTHLTDLPQLEGLYKDIPPPHFHISIEKI